MYAVHVFCSFSYTILALCAFLSTLHVLCLCLNVLQLSNRTMLCMYVNDVSLTPTNHTWSSVFQLHTVAFITKVFYAL